MNNKFLIQEVKRNMDLIHYSRSNSINENSYNATYTYQPVFTDLVTQDGKYAVILDELYDLQTQKLIGNIWEDIDRLNIFLNHLFESAKNISKDLKESLKICVNKFVIVESQQDILKLKNHFRVIREQEEGGFWSSAWDSATDWGKETYDTAVKGVSDFVKTSYEGTKKLISGLSQSDWKKVLDILGKGVLYTARSIRSFLMHPVGIVLDAVLVASGYGKGAVAVPWAIAVGVDLYEILTNNYEESDRTILGGIFQLLTDSLGLLLAGATAKAFAVSAKPLMSARSSKEILSYLKTNPAIKKTLETALQSAKGLKKKLLELIKFIKSKNSSMGSWLEGIVMQFDLIMRRASEGLTKIGFKIVDPKADPIDNMLSAFGISTGLTMAIGTGAQAYGKYQNKKLEKDILQDPNINLFTPEQTDQFTSK